MEMGDACLAAKSGQIVSWSRKFWMRASAAIGHKLQYEGL
jgi:hypothetical protein